MQKPAFVLGNGVSRKSLSIPKLKSNGTVYACNAVYRTEEPDYLVAVDARMILEINQEGYQHTHQVWTNKKRGFEKIKHLNYFEQSRGWSSGPTALWLASMQGHRRIYILGFDYKGIEDGAQINNIFAGTPNYKKKNSTATFYGNWLKQTATVIRENPNTYYTRVIQLGNFCPEELNSFSNFNTISIDEFRKAMPLDPLDQNESF